MSSSSAMLSHISISVSDKESDDLTGKLGVQIRRNRKKNQHPPDLSARILRRFLCQQWWIVLVFLIAIPMLLYQTSKFVRRASHEVPNPAQEVVNLDSGPVKELPANLNRLGPVTRVAAGVKQPCLKVLVPEEIQRLEFPKGAESNSPIRNVVYKSNSGKYNQGSNNALSMQNPQTASFNLFTGFQTLKEREESFKAKETAEVHCGFYDERGGFKISEDDKSYMRTCKAVVSTCTFGGGDELYQPIGMTDASLEKVCYVAFWDEITRLSQEAEGIKINEHHMIGKWRIVIVKDLPFSDQRLNGKIPKMLSHRLFPEARYSIWVDSKSQFRRDPVGVLEALLWRTNSILAISEHGARSSLYDEAKAVLKKNKATPKEVELQLNQYRQDGIPDDKRFNGKKALSEASIIVREHTPSTNLLMCSWFNEAVRFTSRDQLSFSYVLRRLNMAGINIFPVCTRKDLVNSMGHKPKVKLLVKSSSQGS